jgi:hypothetical protein
LPDLKPVFCSNADSAGEFVSTPGERRRHAEASPGLLTFSRVAELRLVEALWLLILGLPQRVPVGARARGGRGTAGQPGPRSLKGSDDEVAADVGDMKGHGRTCNPVLTHLAEPIRWPSSSWRWPFSWASTRAEALHVFREPSSGASVTFGTALLGLFHSESTARRLRDVDGTGDTAEACFSTAYAPGRRRCGRARASRAV